MSETRLQLRQRWQGIIEQQRLSGQCVGEYARQHGLSPHRFYVWRRRLQASHGVAGFVEAKPVSPPRGSVIEVCLRGRRRLRLRRGFDPALLTDVVRTLEGLS